MNPGGKRWGIALLGLSLTAACATPHDQPVEWEQTIRATARITSIDHDARRMEVRSLYRRLTVRVADSVESFDTRKVGDTLNLVYYEAVVVAPAPKDGQGFEELTKYHLSPATEEHAHFAHTRARQFIAEFLNFDYQSSIATFRKSDNEYPLLIVPLGLRPFVRTLVPGDEIAVSVEEAITVSISPDG